MNRPTFFISSTIHDFRDLRSALKFYLEEHGCTVLASEFNDFGKPLDAHSYEACLQSIHSADYFILLIGGRVGGWYDERSRVSITQREYREAYDLQSTGKIRLVNFVRSDLWQAREERRELERLLKTMSIKEADRRDIANYPSKFASDAAFLSTFIAEVSRTEETKLAAQGNGTRPAGNWLHVFSSFRDIVDVLDHLIFSSTPVEDMTNKRLLRSELYRLLEECIPKMSGQVYSLRSAIMEFHRACPITMETRRSECIAVRKEDWRCIRALSFCLLARQLHTTVLPQLLSRPTFLEFDLGSCSYKETAVYKALLHLDSEIRIFNRQNTSETLSVIYRDPASDMVASNQIEVETVSLGCLFHLLDRWSNITDLCCSLIRYLDGESFEMPDLWPFSPVQGMTRTDETATGAEIDDYIWRTEV